MYEVQIERKDGRFVRTIILVVNGSSKSECEELVRTHPDQRVFKRGDYIRSIEPINSSVYVTRRY